MRAVVVGTGYEGREKTIRRHCYEGMAARLVREPNNSHDPNAIAVYIDKPRLLFGVALKQIGYIKADRAENLCKRLDDGEVPDAKVVKLYAPPDREFPKISLDILFD